MVRLSPDRRATDPLAPAARAVALTRWGMIAERGMQALWLPVSLVLIAVTIWAFDLHLLLSRRWLMAIAGLMAVAFLLSAYRGLRAVSWPSRAEAVARLDRTLPGRPLAALSDGQAINGQDAASVALWQEHRRRMEARAGSARAVAPDAGLATRDVYGVRLIAITGALVALLFATPGQRAPMGGVVSAAGAASGPSWEGWIVPPSYTGRPGLYLNDITRDSFEVPQGSQVILRLYGDPSAFSVTTTLSDVGAPQEAQQAQEFEARTSGTLEIDGPGGRTWQVTVLQDDMPEISASGRLRRGRAGVMLQEFDASDDYGVISGEAELVLDLAQVDRRHGLRLPPEIHEALRLPLPLPLSGNRTNITETLSEDLSQHPWAHLPVRVILHATDAAGQVGTAAPILASLPGRRFFEPAARALIEIRRDLLWNAQNARRSAQLMRAMLHRGDDAFVFDGAPVLIRGAVAFIETRLETEDWTPEARDELAEQLWELALLLEEGELANARERLERAQQRLNQAMQDGAAQDEIADLMDELRAATDDYMRMLAEQAEPADDGGDQRDRNEGEQQQITQDQIQEMMDQIQELMEAGRMEEAAALMEQLNQLLENLRMQRGEGGEGMPGDETMEQFGESLDEQQSLADETFRELQEQFGEDGQERKPDEDAMAEMAERQRALRERLREQQLGDVPGEGTSEAEAGLDALDEAQRSMEEAAEALDEGDLRGALERQAEALEELREGLRAFRDAQDSDEREASDRENDEQQGQGGGRDPLGRDLGRAEEGREGATVPGVDPGERARDLLDEIRRRSAERERDEAELDYLNRLIERF